MYLMQVLLHRNYLENYKNFQFCLFSSSATYFSTVTFTAVFFGFAISSCCVLFDIIKDLLRHEVCTADSKQLRAAFYGAECLQMWFYST